MIPGTVDPKTGNVPLHLPGGYLVHFEGRESDGRVHARLARGTSGPVRTFDDVDDLYDYIDAALPPIWDRIPRAVVTEWLHLRAAEASAA